MLATTPPVRSIIPATLFPYQLPIKETLVSWALNDNPAIVNTLVAPMACGKTAITCAATEDIVRARKRVWIVVNRIELVDQWRSELQRFAAAIRHVGQITRDTKQLRAVVVIVQAQTLQRYLAKVPDQLKPDVVFYDEAHETAFTKVAVELRNRFKLFKQINLTATPARHGSSNIQYADLFPREHWHVAITAKKLIEIGRWKKPVWKLASEALAKETASRFSGVKISGGEYDETSQAAVMIDLLPKQLAEALPQIGTRSTVWFCVNTKHAQEVYKALALNSTVAFVSGDDQNTVCNVELPPTRDSKRSKIVSAFKAGAIQHYVTIQTATTGFDAPIASCAVWLRKTLSVGLFCQMAGRVLRKYDQVALGLLLDLAGNLGLHPFPEDIDWLEFEPSKKLFRDPSLYVCKKCGNRHKSIPTPLDPQNMFTFQISQGTFEDGRPCDMHAPIKCHACKSDTYFDRRLLASYGRWLTTTAAKAATGAKPEKHKESTAGIAIGAAAYDEVLTPADLYGYDVWRLSSGGTGEGGAKDKSQEFLQIYKDANDRVKDRETTALKLSYMRPTQQYFLEHCRLADIRACATIEASYKAGLAYAYTYNKSPIWAYQFWNHPDNANPTHATIQEFFRSIAVCPESIELVREWLRHWAKEHESKREQRKSGLIRGWMGKYLPKPAETDQK